MADIEQFDYETKAERGFWFDLLSGKDYKPSGIELHLVGMDSKTYESAALDYQRETEGLDAKNPEDAEKIELAKARLLARCTKGWKGLEEKGKPVEFSFDAAVRIYKAYKGAREQVDREIVNRKRLFEISKDA
jgi:hypothetical protein